MHTTSYISDGEFAAVAYFLLINRLRRTLLERKHILEIKHDTLMPLARDIEGLNVCIVKHRGHEKDPRDWDETVVAR